jgi:hypothetical protein
LKHKDNNTKRSLTSPCLKAKGFYAPLDKGEEIHYRIPAPTPTQLHKWLREKHNLHIVLEPKRAYPDNMVVDDYSYTIYHNEKYIEDDGVYSYDKCFEASFKAALPLI